MADVYYDGVYTTPFQIGAAVPEFLPETKSMLWRARYHCLISYFYAKINREDYDSKGLIGTPMAGLPLVETSAMTDQGGGVCEFERTFAEIPAKRSGPAVSQSVGYQSLIVGSPPGIIEVTAGVSVRTIYEYFFTPNISASVPANGPARLVKIQGNVYSTGGPGFTGGALSDADTVEIWKGHIYVRKRVVAPSVPLDLVAF